jgi:hypothetical protein
VFGPTSEKIEVINEDERKIFSPKTGVSFMKPLNSVLGNSLDLTGFSGVSGNDY